MTNQMNKFRFSHFWRRLAMAIAAIGVIASVAWIAATLAEKQAIADLRLTTNNRLDLYRSNLVNALDRHKNLALALASNREIHGLLDRSNDGAQPAGEISRQFRELAEKTGVLAIFLINNQARVISSSNYKSVDSFIGQILDYRQYYEDALKTGEGLLFAIGTDNAIPGYYIARSTPKRDGVVVIKVGVGELERAWQHAPERVMVTDRHGVVFLTNVETWRYGSLTPLDAAAMAEIDDKIQYFMRRIEPLPLRFIGDDVLAINGRHFLAETTSLPDRDWTLRVLTGTESIRRRVSDAALLAGTGSSLVLGGAIFFIQRRRALKERRAFQERTKMEKDMAQRKVAAQEEVLARVSSELHEGLAGELIAAKYKFELAEKKLGGNIEATKRFLGDGLEKLIQAIKEVRRISHGLRPAVLDRLGLSAAIDQLKTEFEERTGVRINLENTLADHRFNEKEELTLYRIAQEALTNIEHHAAATEVRVMLSREPEGVRFVIADNGRGFDVGDLNRAGGVGLRNMRERVEYLNGRFDIFSEPGCTKLMAILPGTSG